MIKRLFLFGLSVLGVIALIAFSLRSTPEKQRAILEKYLGKPLHSQIIIVGYGQLVGIAGSISVFDLSLDGGAVQAILNRSNYSIPPDLEGEKFALKKVLERYGNFKVSDLSEFAFYEKEQGTYTVRLLIKVPNAYCVISR